MEAYRTRLFSVKARYPSRWTIPDMIDGEILDLNLSISFPAQHAAVRAFSRCAGGAASSEEMLAGGVTPARMPDTFKCPLVSRSAHE